MRTELKITRAAKAAFLKNGYKNASVREIATTVGMTTGAIYGIFCSKQHLFDAIVEDAVREMVTIIERSRHQNFSLDGLPRKDVFDVVEKYFHDITEELLGCYFRHREALDLVLFKSEGSTYASFVLYLEDVTAIRLFSFYRLIAGPFDEITKLLLINISRSYVYNLLDGLQHLDTNRSFSCYVHKLQRMFSTGFRMLCDDICTGSGFGACRGLEFYMSRDLMHTFPALSADPEYKERTSFAAMAGGASSSE